MPYNVLLFPLLGGYIFILNFHPFSFWTRKLSSYQLLFVSAVAGVCSLLASTIILSIVCWEIPKSEWGKLLGINWFIPSGLSFLLGFTSFGLNKLSRHLKSRTIIKAASHRNDSLHLFFIQALMTRTPVAISLKSGKVYIGYITSDVESYHEEMKYAKILPVYSGYRDPENKQLVLTNNYAATIKELGFELRISYDIIIPISEIETGRFYDNELFKAFNPKK